MHLKTHMLHAHTYDGNDKMVNRKPDKRVSKQVMGNLPTDRLKPAPPWYSTGIDLFGPYRIRDEVKKRTTNSLLTTQNIISFLAKYNSFKLIIIIIIFLNPF